MSPLIAYDRNIAAICEKLIADGYVSPAKTQDISVSVAGYPPPDHVTLWIMKRHGIIELLADGRYYINVENYRTWTLKGRPFIPRRLLLILALWTVGLVAFVTYLALTVW